MENMSPHAAIFDSTHRTTATYQAPKNSTVGAAYVRIKPRTQRERVATYMQAHACITLRQLLAVAGIREENVMSCGLPSLVYDLQEDGIYQTTTEGLDSVFERNPAKPPVDCESRQMLQ